MSLDILTKNKMITVETLIDRILHVLSFPSAKHDSARNAHAATFAMKQYLGSSVMLGFAFSFRYVGSDERNCQASRSPGFCPPRNNCAFALHGEKRLGPNRLDLNGGFGAAIMFREDGCSSPPQRYYGCTSIMRALLVPGPSGNSPSIVHPSRVFRKYLKTSLMRLTTAPFCLCETTSPLPLPVEETLMIVNRSSPTPDCCKDLTNPSGSETAGRGRDIAPERCYCVRSLRMW